MDATLNYKAFTSGTPYYEVYYSIESGLWCADLRDSSDTFSVRNEEGITSAHLTMQENETLSVYVAKTDVSDTYYHSTYHASSGAITATEHNITTTITALS